MDSVIHSLDLSEGGGVINLKAKSDPEPGISICIGIGGTGTAALRALKRKVCAQFTPSNNPVDKAGNPVPDPGPNFIPKYKNIRFLAIDADYTEFKINAAGQLITPPNFFDLDPTTEFICIADSGSLGNPMLMKMPEFNGWMNIKNIRPNLTGDVAGGVRQIGRYLLIKNSKEIYDRISQITTDAMAGSNTAGSVDIHIFAGISGGTGSGGFIDTCYLIRQLASSNGWRATIYGYFFLPDVVLAKPEVQRDSIRSRMNQINGYAALKELDYLMALKESGEYFEQYYPGGIGNYRTNEPPVDMCQLISATAANGNIMADGFNDNVNVAADYVMAYLAHLANPVAPAVAAGVDQIRRTAGAPLGYSIIGAANAEIPMTQIATYLAAGYYKKLVSLCGTVNDNAVEREAKGLGLTHDNLMRLLMNGMHTDFDITIDMKSAEVGKGDDRIWPRGFLVPAQNMEAFNAGIYKENGKGMTTELPDDHTPSTDPNSVIGKIDNRLRALALDGSGDAGPRYAASMLHANGKDFVKVLTGLIKENSELQLAIINNDQIEFLRGKAEEAKDAFIDASFLTKKKRYEEYIFRFKEWIKLEDELARLQELEIVLKELKEELEQLYAGYYKPFSDTIDSLEKTFRDNAEYLNSPQADKTDAYTQRIVQLSSLRKLLDGELAAIPEWSALQNIVGCLMNPDNQDAWLSGSDYRIGRVINVMIQNQFQNVLNKSLDDYITMGLPQGASAAAITQHIDSTVIQPTCGRATPMFWLKPNTVSISSISDHTTFSTNILNVPSVCQQVANAGMTYAANSNYMCRLTGLSDRIFAMQIRSGVPLYAYQGVYNFQEAYNAKIKAGEPGVHLYEVNTALAAKEDKTAEDIAALERANWATWLPSPIPYSVDPNSVPNGKEKEQVYKDAVAAGIIRKNPVSLKWQVLESSVTLDKINALKHSSFLAADGALKALRGTKDSLYAEGNYTAHDLEDKSEPQYTQAVLLDWFIRCPLLVRIAENELNKIKALDGAIVSQLH